MKRRTEAHLYDGAGRMDPSRRMVLRQVGSALLAAPLLPWLGCSSSASASGDAAAADASGGADGGAGAAGSGGAGGSATAADGGGIVAGWATGGTAAMTGKATYPNPFAGAAPTSCALSCTATQGPCYSDQSEVIQDISYGYAGLPTRVCFRVLDETCAPVVGASVDVWHVSAVGKYSGDDSAHENIAFCTGNDPDFTSHLYFRGQQLTDATGVVFFDNCYPGWYTGRTVHIHFTVRIGGAELVTSQVFFDDSLNDDILNGQALYSSRGARSTTNQNDSVVSAAAVGDYTLQTMRMADGALLAWKTLIIRSSSAASLCTIPAGSGGGRGPAGGPDGGPPPGP